MSQSKDASGPQFRADRPAEQEAVRTTIVGGRPPGSGKPLGDIPRGIEVLVKKASVDPEFKQRLLDGRDEAAGEIDLALEPAEVLMLRAVPVEHLETIIAQTSVSREHRRAFLGTAAAAMLAAIGVVVVVPGCLPDISKGSRPGVRERAREKQKKTKSPTESKTDKTVKTPERPKRLSPTKGERPDFPKRFKITEDTDPKLPEPEPPSSDAEKNEEPPPKQ